MKKLKLLMVFLLMGMSSVLWAQNEVSGAVYDEMGMPIPGVSVIIKGTTNGTAADFDGKFKVSATSGEVIVFSSLGYQSN